MKYQALFFGKKNIKQRLALVCCLLNLTYYNWGYLISTAYHYENTSRNGKFSGKKNSDIFHISAQNIDCGYLLEPPWRGGFNEYPQSMF